MVERTEFTTELGLVNVEWKERTGEPNNYIIVQSALHVEANELIRALISLPTDRAARVALTHQQWLLDPNRGLRTTLILDAIEWNPNRKDSIFYLHLNPFSPHDFVEFMKWIAQQKAWDPDSSNSLSLTEDERRRFTERIQWAEQLLPRTGN